MVTNKQQYRLYVIHTVRKASVHTLKITKGPTNSWKKAMQQDKACVLPMCNPPPETADMPKESRKTQPLTTPRLEHTHITSTNMKEATKCQRQVNVFHKK